jgi:hypothetical protein
VEYETAKRHYAHVDCPGHADYVKVSCTIILVLLRRKYINPFEKFCSIYMPETTYRSVLGKINPS